jgi:hypothetical protein
LKSSLDSRAVANARLARQFLTTAGPTKASDIVRALGAVQAQDFAGGKWALAQRTRGLTDVDVEREFADGNILRTHVLRPTWHFVSPSDIRWMLALTAPRVKAAMAYHGRTVEVTPEILRRSNAALTKALAGGKHLTRLELAKVLERAGVKMASGQRLAHLVMEAELDAVVCSGPRRGKQFTYALLEERVPPAPQRERDEALLELIMRYFTTRGPATARDFAWWSGLAMSDVKRGLEIAGRELQHATLNGQDVWFDDRATPKAKPSAHLLPNYDEYFIGYKDRSAIAQRLGHAKLVEGGNFLLANVVFVDGQLVGGWRRRLDKSAAVVELELLSKLTSEEKERVGAAANRFGTFLRSAVELR